MSLNIDFTPEVKKLIKNIGGIENLEDYLNEEIAMVLKNKLYGRCYYTIRLPKKVQAKINHLKEQTGFGFTKIVLFAIDELYIDYQEP